MGWWVGGLVGWFVGLGAFPAHRLAGRSPHEASCRVVLFVACVLAGFFSRKKKSIRVATVRLGSVRFVFSVCLAVQFD